jgi:hypothetical protein
MIRSLTVVAILLACAVAGPLALQRSTPQARPTCPPSGKNRGSTPVPGSDEAMRNERKRTVPTAVTASARLLTLDDFKSLQAQVDKLFPGMERPEFTGNRNALKNLTLDSGAISEGDLVRVVGFLTVARAEGPESVNCESTTVIDFHINVGPTKTATEFQGVVVEIIPQHRPAGLQTKHALEQALARVVKETLNVMVVGQLMLDNEHVVNDDPAHPKGDNPKRISVWEIHPITTLLVCSRTACDPQQISQWTPLQRLRTS